MSTLPRGATRASTATAGTFVVLEMQDDHEPDPVDEHLGVFQDGLRTTIEDVPVLDED